MTIVDFLFAEIIMNAQIIKIDFENKYPNVWKYFQGLIATVPELKADDEAVKEIIELMA